MTCDFCADNFTAYLEDELPEAARAELDAHLRDCVACADSLAEFRQAIALFRSLPTLQPPRDLHERVLSELQASVVAPRPRPWWQMASSLAAAAALMLGLAFWGYTQWRPQATAPAGAPAALAGPEAPVASPKAEGAEVVAPTPAVPESAVPESAAPQAAEPAAPRGTGAAHSAEADTPGAPPPARRAGRTLRHEGDANGGNARGGVLEEARAERTAPEPATPRAVAPLPPSAVPSVRVGTPGVSRRGDRASDAARGPVLTQGFPGAAGPGDVAQPVAKALAGEAGPRGQQGPAGPVSPGGGAMAAMAAPLSPAPSAAQGGTQLRVLPPSRCVVGRSTWVSVSVTSEVAATDVRITVQSSPGAEIMGAPAGVVYRGGLAARRTVFVPVELFATRPGPAHLRVSLRSEKPELAFALTASTPAFSAAGDGEASRPDAVSVTLNFDEEPLRDAFVAIGRQARVRVIPGDGIGRQPVTVDFSRGVPVDAALRILADAGGCHVVRTRDAYRIEAGPRAAPR